MFISRTIGHAVQAEGMLLGLLIFTKENFSSAGTITRLLIEY